jgi:hypothetical protein
MRAMQILITGALLAMAVDGLAQAPTGPQGSANAGEPKEESHSKDFISQADLKRLAELVDQWSRVEGGGVKPRVAKIRTKQMLKVLRVSCEMTDAAYQGRTPAGTGSGDSEAHIYEAACADGMGYVMTIQGQSLTGTSCLAAVQDGSKVPCALPANLDRKAMAGAVLRSSSVQCAVRDLKWLGSDASNRDHVEVACEDGGGYVVRSPRPGVEGKRDVLGCEDAAKLGVVCGLTAGSMPTPAAKADARPNLAWFKDALAKNGVSCESKQARIVGRESIKRRYLVEFDCKDHPEGLVAIVPPADDTTNKFETMNCATAATRGVQCQFVAKESLTPGK